MSILRPCSPVLSSHLLTARVGWTAVMTAVTSQHYKYQSLLELLPFPEAWATS
ncbi:unnamed protein product [Timema podura]|uniref:Uncharacterized protein n=1 Tax=Timema podura TaxID=61482 RepID=A0ABN7PK91_TIMPD|nr:unnamed protein product [Timema podura]